MKAAVVNGPETAPVYADFAEPVLDDASAEVELVAAGIHPIVRSRVAGRHYSSAGGWPAVPGVDAVARTADGRLVYTGFVAPPWGTMAERLAVPARFGVELPTGADPLAVAAGMNPGLASWLPLSRRADELSGGPGLGTVLVLGATGMAGGLAVDNAYALGATTVVAVGRSAERLAALGRRSAGDLRTVAIGDSGRLADDLADALERRPPSAVIDFAWGPVAEAAFRALGRADLDTDGYDVGYVQVGAMAGAEAGLPAALLRSRRIAFTGSGLGGTPVAELMARMPGFLVEIAAGRVHVPYAAFPLSRIGEAWAAPSQPRAVVVPG